MHRGGIATAVFAAALVASVATSVSAHADGGGPIVVTDGSGVVDTTIHVPGVPGGATDASASGPGGNGGSGITCDYVLDTSNITHHPQDYPDLANADFTKGTYYYRYCSDGTAAFVWVPNGPGGVVGGVPALTPAQLAQEATARLLLAKPSIRRSPNQDLRYDGDPYTWVHIWTWFWTDPATYKALTQTLAVGGVSATVTAKPVGLLYDPGNGDREVRCAGPGKAWTDSDGNAAPSSGCGYEYSGVTAGVVTTRVTIIWQVSWSGSGGTGGVLPQLQTQSTAPLRVLQAQVVNQ
jgi:hypothetical protein